MKLATHHARRYTFQPGMHPCHVTTTLAVRGVEIMLTAAVYQEWPSPEPVVDVWGRIAKGSPIRPPRNHDRSLVKYGGVVGYLASPDRGLFHYITIGQYLSLCEQAKAYFGLPNTLRT